MTIRAAHRALRTAAQHNAHCPADCPPRPPTHLLYSATLREMVNEFQTDFDMVLIDTQPMLQMPDARIIGRLGDGVILVVRAGKTTRDAAQAARERLAEDRTKVIGISHKGGYGAYRYHSQYHER